MTVILIFVAACAVSFLLEAGIVWLLVWAIKAIGITTIGSWTVSFSWPLVVIFWLISLAFKSSSATKKK